MPAPAVAPTRSLHALPPPHTGSCDPWQPLPTAGLEALVGHRAWLTGEHAPRWLPAKERRQRVEAIDALMGRVLRRMEVVRSTFTASGLKLPFRFDVRCKTPALSKKSSSARARAHTMHPGGAIPWWCRISYAPRARRVAQALSGETVDNAAAQDDGGGTYTSAR